MSFNGKEGEQISLEQAAELTARYRVSNPDSIKGVFFGREQIEAVLAQGGCMGLRLYYAQNADGSQTLVLVGADSEQNDMLNLIIDFAKPCPTSCSGGNPLNSSLKSGEK